MRFAAVLLLLPLVPAQEIAWKSDFKATLKEAEASKKLVVLVFQSKDRKNCLRFENETLADPGVVAALAKYLCVRVNPEGTDDENRLWQDHRMPTPPMTIIFEPDGKKLAVVTPLNPKVYGPMLSDIVPAYFDKIVPSREALAKDPNQAGPNRALGEAYMTLDNSDASAKHYNAAADLLVAKGDKAGALDLLIAQLDKYYEKKWYSPARGCCSRIADLDPDNKTTKRPMAAWVLGMASCAEGRWAEAIDGLQEACARYKDDELLPKMMFTLGSAHMYAKDIDSAITVFGEIVKKYHGTETAEIANTQLQKLKAQREKAAEGK
jgi:tetratricopeptide (TPR) repeat protein